MTTTRRQSIEVEGFGHSGNPIPAASRVGNIVMSGGISGQDPATGKVAPEANEQVRLVFENLERIVTAAGGTLEDIVKVGVILKSLDLRGEVNTQWLKYFPDEHSRPARHTMQYDYFAGATVIQLEMTAVLK